MYLKSRSPLINPLSPFFYYQASHYSVRGLLAEVVCQRGGCAGRDGAADGGNLNKLQRKVWRRACEWPGTHERTLRLREKCPRHIITTLPNPTARKFLYRPNQGHNHHAQQPPQPPKPYPLLSCLTPLVIGTCTVSQAFHPSHQHLHTHALTGINRGRSCTTTLTQSSFARRPVTCCKERKCEGNFSKLSRGMTGAQCSPLHHAGRRRRRRWRRRWCCCWAEGAGLLLRRCWVDASLDPGSGKQYVPQERISRSQ